MISGSTIIHGIKVIPPLTSLSLLLVVSSLDQVSGALVSHVWSSVQRQCIENWTSWLQKSWTWEVSRFWELILGASPGQIVWIVWFNVGIITFQCFQVCLSVCVPQVCNWVCWIGWNKAYQISCFDLYGSTQDASILEPGSIATNECNWKSDLKVWMNCRPGVSDHPVQVLCLVQVHIICQEFHDLVLVCLNFGFCNSSYL